MNRADLRAHLVAEEGMRLKPYRCTEGRLTIGVGRNLDDVGITEAEALALLEHDMDRVCGELDRAVPGWRLWPHPVGTALCSMTFQMGIGGVLAFRKMLDAMKAGDWKEAARQARDSRWARQTPERAARVTKMIEEAE